MKYVDPETVDSGKYEVETSAKTLLLPKKQQEQFELGSWYVISRWEILNTAVEEAWGGSDSGDKRDWLVGQIVDLFETTNYVGLFEIQSRFLQVMNDEFDVVVEDDSELPIAMEVIDLYRDCQKGDFAKIKELQAEFEEKERLRAQGKLPKAKIEIVKGDDDDDEEEDWSDEGDDDEEVPELKSQKDTEMEEAQKGPIIDEDGFELVTKKGRGKR